MIDVRIDFDTGILTMLEPGEDAAAGFEELDTLRFILALAVSTPE